MADRKQADPAGHYPYKHEHVSKLIEENPPYGPDGPDDDRVRVEDFISQEIADANRAYIEAQAAYLHDPSDAAAQELYEQAANDLVAARQAHRANRPQGPVVVGIRARRAGE